MKIGAKGFTLIELLITGAISAIIATAAGSVIFQTFKGLDRNNDQMTVVRQLENAGYWLSRDIQMAVTASTNVTGSDFLRIYWAEWDAAGNPTYYSVRYFFDNVTSGVGKLEREHLSGGVTKRTLVARYIYYNPSQTDNTSKATYEPPVLTVKLVARSGDTQETREYKAKRRPNF